MSKLFDLSEVLKEDDPQQLEAVVDGSGCIVKEAANTQFLVSNSKTHLKDHIKSLQKGHDFHLMTNGNWSTHELILHLLSIIGPAHLYFTTWSMKETPVRMLMQAIEDKTLLSVSAVLDARVWVRNPSVLLLAKNQFAKVRVHDCHAKVTVLENDEWKLSIVGSANMTTNPRVEACVISTNPEVAAFHKDWILKLIETGKLLEYVSDIG